CVRVRPGSRHACIVTDPPADEVSESVARISLSSSQHPLHIACVGAVGRVYLMTSSIDVLCSELQSMFADHFGDIVAEADGSTGVIPGLKRGLHGEAGAAISGIAASNDDARKFSAESVFK